MFTTYVIPSLEQEAVVAGVDKVIAKSDGAASSHQQHFSGC
jgi:hypothetical protein